MQWSKLRSHLRSLVTPDLRKRIDFHLLNYRKLSEYANEFVITVDGQKLFSSSYSQHNIASYQTERRTGLSQWGDGLDACRLEDILTKSEIHDPAAITSSIRTYFDIDPHLALSSTDPFLRALAIVDRRVGRRTLDAMEIPETEHSLVKLLFKLRMECFSEKMVRA
jgi:hypothetical protein